MERYRDSTDPPTNGISNASKSALWIRKRKASVSSKDKRSLYCMEETTSVTILFDSCKVTFLFSTIFLKVMKFSFKWKAMKANLYTHNE